MDLDHLALPRLVDRLRRVLPITAYPRQAVLAYLCANGVSGGRAPHLSVIDIFDSGQTHGFLCRFLVCGDARTRSFVAPLAQISIDRKHPTARALARLVCDRSRGAA